MYISVPWNSKLCNNTTLGLPSFSASGNSSILNHSHISIVNHGYIEAMYTAADCMQHCHGEAGKPETCVPNNSQQTPLSTLVRLWGNPEVATPGICTFLVKSACYVFV